MLGCLKRGSRSLTLTVTSQDWIPLDQTERANAEHSIDKIQTEALRQLAPNSGAYINEVRITSSSVTIGIY
jgi:hypothetical protein